MLMFLLDYQSDTKLEMEWVWRRLKVYLMGWWIWKVIEMGTGRVQSKLKAYQLVLVMVWLMVYLMVELMVIRNVLILEFCMYEGEI